MNVPDNSSHFLYVAKGSTGQPRWRSVNLELKNNAKRFANTDIFVIIPFKRNQKNINTVAKIAKLLPLSINSSLLRELDDAIHTDDAGNEGYIIKKEIELPETDGINNLKINIDLIIFNDFIKANEAYYNIEYYNQQGGKRNVGNIYRKKSYKKRSRKRSTKKRARRRTKKAGEYSKMHRDLVTGNFHANKYNASLGDEGEAAYLQRKADATLLHLATKGHGNFGPDGKPVTPIKKKILRKKALQAKQRLLSRIPHQKPRGRIGRHKPLNARTRLAEQIILTKDETEPDKKRRKITFGKGGKRKRKTRRRRRRRR